MGDQSSYGRLNVSGVGLLILALVVTGLYLVATIWIEPRRTGQGAYEAERSAMPAELASASLVMSEERRLLRASLGPHQFVAKPDQVFRTQDGRLVLVENKTRQRVVAYDADVIELTVQAFALRHSKPTQLLSSPVADHAYVRVVSGGRSKYVRVRLLGDDALAELADRYVAIRARRRKPGSQASLNACRKCAYQPKCPVRSRNLG